jgi:hypothetical protein
LKEVASKVLDEFKINTDVWGEIVHEYMVKAVKNIKPSSRLLNDSIDITKFIKIFLFEWKD